MPNRSRKRGGHLALAGGRTHESEHGQIEADRLRGRSLAKDDVELEVLHRRIEDFFDRARQAMDLVDEEHRPRARGWRDRRQVARALEGRRPR